MIALAVAARAADPGAALVDQLLEASLAGSDADHVGALTALANEVAAGDPTGPEVRYWLARAQAERGDVDAARSALLDGIRTGSCVPCRELFQALEIDRLAADRGVVWTFEDPHHGVFLGEPSGALRLEVADGRRVLEWTPEPGPETSDHLLIGLRDGMTSVRFEARAAWAPVALQVRAVDAAGRRAAWPAPVVVPADRWVTVILDPRGLVAEGGAGAVDPARLRRLALATGAPGRGAGGAPALWIDSLEVR